jgi:hypothetical protein
MEDVLVRIAEEVMPSRSMPLPEDLRLRATRTVDFGESGWGEAAIRMQERCVPFVQNATGKERRLSEPIVERYGDAIYTTRLLRLFASALGKLHEDSYQPESRDADQVDWESEVLMNLFWTGQLVASEVILLLSRGFPAGALARWRALRELVVRAKLIRAGGRGLAKRFHAHEQMRIRNQQRSFMADRRDKEKMRAWAKLDDELRAEYGRVFGGEYGWAHELMLEKSENYARAYAEGKRERGPRFSDLDRTIDEAPSDLAYGDASFAVHGSVASVMDDEGPVAEIRRGPSAYSMAWAGFWTAADVGELTRAYVGRDATDPRMPRLLVLVPALTDAAEDEWQLAWEDDNYQAQLTRDLPCSER